MFPLRPGRSGAATEGKRGSPSHGHCRSTPTFLISHPWLPTRMLASSRAGVFVSTDRGETWSEARPTGTTPSVLSFAFRPTNAGIILGAAGPQGVLLTSDGGISWEKTRFGFGQDTVQHDHAGRPGSLSVLRMDHGGRLLSLNQRGTGVEPVHTALGNTGHGRDSHRPSFPEQHRGDGERTERIRLLIGWHTLAAYGRAFPAGHSRGARLARRLGDTGGGHIQRRHLSHHAGCFNAPDRTREGKSP